MKKKQIVILCAVLALLLIVAAAVILMVNKYNQAKAYEDADFFGSGGSGDLQTAKSDEVTLTFYFPGQNGPKTREVLDAVEKKSKGELNAKLDFKWVSQSGYFGKVQAAIASGSPCDAFAYSNYFEGESGLQRLVRDKSLADITELFPKYAPELYKKYPREALDSASYDGRLYAVPGLLPVPQRRCALVRDDLMEKYSIPDIKNYDDLEVYLKAIAANEKSIVPLTLYDTTIGLFAEAYGYAILDYQLGLVYKWNDPDMKLIAWEQTPEFLQSIEKFRDWKKAGYMPMGINSVPIDEKMAASGKYAAIISTLNQEAIFNAAVMAANGDGWKYKAYPLYQDKMTSRSSPTDSALVFNAKSKNIARALMFVNWLQSDQENYDLLMYGIEGKDYLLYGDQIGFPNEKAFSNAYINWPGRWAFANIDHERTTTGSKPDFKASYIKYVNDTSKYPPHTGFHPDFSAVQTEAIERRGSFYKLEGRISSGLFTEDDTEEYVAQNRENAEKLLSVIQRQLDRWKAEKQ